jgi:cytochrome P450
MLPPMFAELEPFAPTWCLATEPERWRQRHASTMAELTEFYDAFFPRIEEAIEYCDTFALDDLPPEVTNLLRLISSLVMVSMAIEIFGQPATVDAADATLNRIREPTP